MTGPTTIWVVIAGCTVATVLLKGAGPALFGGREPSPALLRVIAMTAPALLAALVVTSALADGDRLTVGAETVGVLVAGVVLLCGRSVVLAVVVAAVVTAVLRAVT